MSVGGEQIESETSIGVESFNLEASVGVSEKEPIQTMSRIQN